MGSRRGRPLAPEAAPQTIFPGAGSTTVYNVYKAGCMGAATTGPPAARIDLGADTIKAMLVNTTLTVNPDNDFVADIVANEISTGGYTGGFGGSGRKLLASKTITADDANDRGAFGCANITWAALATGATIGGIVLFKELTSDALSPLICYLAITNLPTNGSDVVADFSAGALRLT